MRTATKKRKASESEKKWVRIVRDGEAWENHPHYVFMGGELGLEEHNKLAAEYKLAPWKSVDPLTEEEIHALDLLEWERKQSLQLLESIVTQVGAGYYNDDIIKHVTKFVEMEYRDSPKLKIILATLRRATPRTVCGPVEGWILAALNTFSWDRTNQYEAKKKVYERIEARFLKSSPASGGGEQGGGRA